MVCLADRINFQLSLKRDEECWIFEFEVHNTENIRCELASKASIYGLGGFVRRTSKDCVKCKVVSSLDNAKNLSEFLRELHVYPKKNLIYTQEPVPSTDEQDLDVASSKKFVVYPVVSNLRNVVNLSPDTKEGLPWENVSVASSRSVSETSVR
jgi:hypothetical protein